MGVVLVVKSLSVFGWVNCCWWAVITLLGSLSSSLLCSVLLTPCFNGDLSLYTLTYPFLRSPTMIHVCCVFNLLKIVISYLYLHKYWSCWSGDTSTSVCGSQSCDTLLSQNKHWHWLHYFLIVNCNYHSVFWLNPRDGYFLIAFFFLKLFI